MNPIAVVKAPAQPLERYAYFLLRKSVRALLHGLHELELDLHRHIHKENNILFPRALQLEAALPR